MKVQSSTAKWAALLQMVADEMLALPDQLRVAQASRLQSMAAELLVNSPDLAPGAGGAEVR